MGSNQTIRRNAFLVVGSVGLAMLGGVALVVVNVARAVWS
jgi:hypothetical protein